MPHFGPIREMVRTLAKRALVAGLVDHDPVQAWSDVDAMFVLAEWVAREPLLISYLSGLACRGIARQTASDLLALGVAPPEPGELIARIRQAIISQSAELARAHHGERLGMMRYFEGEMLSRRDWLHGVTQWAEVPNWLDWCDPWLTPVLSPLARPRLYQELRICHEHHLAVALALRRPEAGLPRRLEQIENDLDARGGLLAPSIVAYTSKIAGTHFISLTEQRQLLVLLAAFQHRRDHGRWPHDVDELELPADMVMDATCDQPLQLRVNATEIVVYGYGLDGDDDGGKPLPRLDYATGDGDIVVRVTLDSGEPPEGR
jgi:hypothetical protein